MTKECENEGIKTMKREKKIYKKSVNIKFVMRNKDKKSVIKKRRPEAAREL